MDDAPSWPAPWIRASLDLAILSVLQVQTLHGYAIAEQLERAGLGRLKGGSLYPVLARLEQAGFIEAVWLPGESGPGRKAYSLAASGRAEQARLATAWGQLTERLAGLGRIADNDSTLDHNGSD